ncbi:thiamine phosphate synthase [Clostridium novyi]|uniref:Thiamine-phosphate synthase n=1 Tax=Clostridium novyi (strain NT) TaxID=386415 RepID=THIE_CLONN|nr:thiamine phosphate synthase [Clostridium novyi]A0Q2A0.1 RecName: Full=Thiamine-phosphate synthase; Short=TP synthase; Short=TPS; AltName: Full=Thiamine-phosphate pyrophosphorylase; Short=TMP pyrophosphorylase; Short=TMP-PPase [Clostridium novyi NT]ABK61946.1 thiamine-phosphate pyrophosphorylase [Clostridium novyi NT]KEH86301.1 thiamine-phosphate synthase [Clostridium novyi A str. NCTC 538]
MDINYKLYLITDRSFLNGRSLAECVEDAIKGGATLVQVREKNISTRDFYNIAREVQEVTTKYNVPLLINDRIDIALAINADGVHLGQSDMPIELARKILGDDKVIGISAGNVKEAIEAEKAGADYVGLGTVFFTGTKKDIDEPIGLAGLKEITEKITIPSVAIGGINKENAKSVLATGVDGISVISAILKNDDIQGASKTLANI